MVADFETSLVLLIRRASSSRGGGRRAPSGDIAIKTKIG